MRQNKSRFKLKEREKRKKKNAIRTSPIELEFVVELNRCFCLLNIFKFISCFCFFSFDFLFRTKKKNLKQLCSVFKSLQGSEELLQVSAKRTWRWIAYNNRQQVEYILQSFSGILRLHTSKLLHVLQFVSSFMPSNSQLVSLTFEST